MLDLRFRHSLAAGLVAVLVCLGLSAESRAQSPVASRQLLQVRQVDDGRWIGWVIIRNRRTMVKIPQTHDEIQEFAERHDVDVKWHTNHTEEETPALLQTSGERDEVDSEPLPMPSPDVALTTPAAIAPEPVDGENPSLAEQTTRLERTIESDKQRLETIRAELADPEGEYQKAEADFKAAEQELATKQAEIAELKESDKAEELKASEESLPAIAARHELARQQFDLAIQTRKTIQEQMAALEEKIVQNQVANDKLTGVISPVTPETPTAVQPAVEPAVPATAAVATPAATGEAPPATVPVPSAETTTTLPSTSQPAGEVTPPATPPAEPANAKLFEAQQRAEQKKEEARAAELEAQSITERIQTLDKTIGLEQKLFVAARKKADSAYQQQRAIQTEYQDKSDAGAPRAELAALAQQRKEIAKNFEKARAEVAERTDHLSQLQSERTALLAEEVTALMAAKEKKGEAAHAEKEVGVLKNPFSIHNMLQWLVLEEVKTF